MFAKALMLPISAVTLLGASQFASAQSIQPTSPCPPGKIAQNKSGTDSHQRTANITEESRKRADDS